MGFISAISPSDVSDKARSKVGALTLTLVAPFVGQIADRLGTRAVALTSSVGLGLGFMLLSHAPARLPVYLAFVVIAVLAGAGASPVVYTRLVKQWSDQARGAALGLAQMATGVAAIAAVGTVRGTPRLAQRL